MIRFNPRPPIQAGETPSLQRAWPTSRFNPRPPIQAGETYAAFTRDVAKGRFQSTPADTGGRNQ